MKPDFMERRCHRRYVLSASEETTGVFSLVDDENRYGFAARIINISEGGLGLAMPNSYNRIRPGDVLILTGVLGARPLGFLSGINMKIKWLQEIPYLQHKAFGCEFMDIPEKARQQIREMFGLERVRQRSDRQETDPPM